MSPAQRREVDEGKAHPDDECSKRPCPQVAEPGAPRADGKPGVDGVLLGPVKGDVEPGAERREGAREPRELSVDAVESERHLQQDGPGDEAGSSAESEANGRKRTEQD